MESKRVIAIIQARMSSSRLPGKVLREIGGHPMLAWVVERTRQAKTVSEVWVATTSDPSDDPVAAFCEAQGYPYYRGSLYDVLDRYYQAAKAAGADVIVRITADCPLIDPDLIDQSVDGYLLAGQEALAQPVFAANRLPPPWGRTYPIGLDVEVVGFADLETAWREAQEKHQREHVMPFFYEQPGRYRIVHLNHAVNYGTLRWTVDTPEDLALVQAVAERFPGRLDFSWLEVLDLFQHEPQLAEINASVKHKNYREVDGRASARS